MVIEMIPTASDWGKATQQDSIDIHTYVSKMITTSNVVARAAPSKNPVFSTKAATRETRSSWYTGKPMIISHHGRVRSAYLLTDATAITLITGNNRSTGLGELYSYNNDDCQHMDVALPLSTRPTHCSS